MKLAALYERCAAPRGQIQQAKQVQRVHCMMEPLSLPDHTCRAGAHLSLAGPLPVMPVTTERVC